MGCGVASGTAASGTVNEIAWLLFGDGAMVLARDEAARGVVAVAGVVESDSGELTSALAAAAGCAEAFAGLTAPWGNVCP